MSALPDESDGRLYAAKCVDQYRSVMAVGGSEASLQRVALPTMGLTGATALRKKGIDRKNKTLTLPSPMPQVNQPNIAVHQPHRQCRRHDPHSHHSQTSNELF